MMEFLYSRLPREQQQNSFNNQPYNLLNLQQNYKQPINRIEENENNLLQSFPTISQKYF